MDNIKKENKEIQIQNKFWDRFIGGYTQCCCDNLRQVERFLNWTAYKADKKKETQCYKLEKNETDNLLYYLKNITKDFRCNNRYYIFADTENKVVVMSRIRQEMFTENFKDIFMQKRIIKKSNIKHDDEHISICKEMNELYKRKNKDYGNSFSKTYAEYGAIMLAIRLEDKLSRYKKLALEGGQAVKNESIRDTLIDLANYSIMGIIELDREREENVKHV